MKFATVLLLLGIILGVNAEVTNNTSDSAITKSESNENLKITDLPKAVQDSVRKECKGKITSIKKVEANNNVYFKVTVFADGKAVTYVFDDKGKLHKKS